MPNEQVLITEQYLKDAGDALRQKLHTDDHFPPEQIAPAILSISGGELEALIATANGEYPPAAGLDGYSDVTVNTPNLTAWMDGETLVLGGDAVAVDGETIVLSSLPVLAGKSITANGNYQPSDDGADGFSAVTVAVGTNLGEKIITDNGIYLASADSLDGYTKVTVQVGLSFVAEAASDPLYPFVTVSAAFDAASLDYTAEAAEEV